MLAAEKRYEYQTSYQRYGLDLKRREMKPEPQKKPKPQPAISPKEKLMIITLTFLMGVVCVGLIATTAYAAKIKYQINTTIKASETLQGEIDNLNVQIKNQSNISIVEQKAKDLGMIYASPEQYVYLDLDNEIRDFAIVLKAQAYN